jgi:hypothetical protein
MIDTTVKIPTDVPASGSVVWEVQKVLTRLLGDSVRVIHRGKHGSIECIGDKAERAAELMRQMTPQVIQDVYPITVNKDYYTGGGEK